MKNWFILPILLLPSTAFAQTTYNLLAPIGALAGPVTLSDYLQGIMQVIIGLAGVLAVVMIVICGIQMMGSPSVSQKSASKECITNAIFGLLIAIGSWIMLGTINTDLLKSDFGLAALPGPVAAAPPPAPTGDEPPPNATGFFFQYLDGTYYKNSPVYDTEPVCGEFMKKAQTEGKVTRGCYYVKKPATPLPPPPPGTPPGQGTAETGASASEISTRAALCGAGLCINSKPYGVNRKPCATPGGQKGESCTNLEGLPLSTISFIKTLPYAPGGNVLITGGTEYNLHKSHKAGQPIFDLRLSVGDPLYNLLKAQPKKPSFGGNFKYIYNGYAFTDEISCGGCARHWHVCQVGTNSSPACTP